MTKQELLKIIEEKIENAEKDREKLYKQEKETTYKNNREKIKELNGEINAYNEVLNLIESSCVLENDR